MSIVEIISEHGDNRLKSDALESITSHKHRLRLDDDEKESLHVQKIQSMRRSRTLMKELIEDYHE